MMQPSQVTPLPPNGYGYTGAMFPAPPVGGWGGGDGAGAGAGAAAAAGGGGGCCCC